MEKLRIAIPNKGRLKDETLYLLYRSGIVIDLSNMERKLSYETADYNFYFLRAQDIPYLISQKVVDCGITGIDIMEEFEDANIKSLLNLNYGNTKMVVATNNSNSNFKNCTSPIKMKVATSFPHITKRFFEAKNVDIDIVYLSGSVEIAPKLGIADAIVDITETGKTLKDNGLKIVDEVLSSEAALIFDVDIDEQKYLQLFKLKKLLSSAIKPQSKVLPLNKMVNNV